MSEPADVLCANLEQLRRSTPALAERILQTDPAPLHWQPSRAGPLVAGIPQGGRTLLLASRYDPLAEAEKLISPVDHGSHGGIFVLGLGLGYHVQRIAVHLGDRALLVVFEPDLGLLRSVLSKIDHTAWLGRPNVFLADDTVDRAALIQRIEGFAASVTQGTILITHPPSRKRQGDALARFAGAVADALSFCRTNVATTLVNSSRTVRNLVLNLPHYVAGANTDELRDAAREYPAVCVGAGPSLARNVHLLADPEVRRNVVLISAQTTLKPLLDRGIRPDFVTALDFHVISQRFYEDLPDLPDVTLVCEPLANATILDSFPGPIRVTGHRYLDRVVRGSPGAAGIPSVPVKHGATVAHLSFYLAQHLGCDPIVFIGQDLGFSDGLYYCPGTAIHNVWAPELNAFNTVEMMEWQRIVRHRAHLKRFQDIEGRPIYSDEQMITYLKQFERDFATAPQRILDATEGGMPKEHAQRTTLAEALDQHATRPVPPLPQASRALDPGSLAVAAHVLDQRVSQVQKLRQLNQQAIAVLKLMLEHQRNERRMNQLFRDMDAIQHRVNELNDAFELINELNTIGAFKRDRTDRAIAHEGVDALERQRRQIERDLENIDWLTQACDEALEIFKEGGRRIAALIQAPDAVCAA